MKSRPLTLAIAAVLAAGATGAAAQTYGQSYQTYQNQYSAYQAQQAAYNEARNKYERERAAYDATYGYGAYARIHGQFSYTPSPTYGYGYGSNPYSGSPYSSSPYSSSPYSSSPYSSSPYAASPYSSYPYASGSYGYNPYAAGSYGVNSSYGGMSCSTGASGSVNLSLLSSLAQAALSGRSAGNVVNEAIMGAVVDRALGSRAISSAQCDSGGYYYTYAQTQPYREGYHDAYGRWVETRASAAYANCRIAPAPMDAAGGSWRYVRVCPDEAGRYRIMG